MRRLSRTSVCAAALLLSGCGPSGEATVVEQAPPSHAMGTPLLPATARELHASRARALRLAPDRRFLLAVADVHHIITRWKRVEVENELIAGKWHVRYLGQEVGTLPEFPDFGDMLLVLMRWAGQVERDHPLKLDAASPKAAVKGELWSHEEAFERLQRAQLAWNASPTREQLHEGTRAVVSLAVQMLDETEVGDAVYGRALAMLALDVSIGKSAPIHEMMLLTHAMGFAPAAKSPQLPLDGDPVNAFVHGDDATLAKVMDDPARDTPTVRMLRHARLLATHDFAGAAALRARKLRDRVLSPALLVDRLRADDPSAVQVAHTLIAVSMLHVAREATVNIARRMADDVRPLGDSDLEMARAVGFVAGWLEVQHEDLVARMEPELPKVGLSDAGPFMDTATHQAFYLALTYSALHHLALHGLANNQPATKVLSELRSAKSPLAVSFREFVVKLFDAQVAKVSIPDLFVNQMSLAALGGRPATELLGALARQADVTDPPLASAIVRLLPRLDTRLTHRGFLGWLARDVLLDPLLAERVRATLPSSSSTALGLESMKLPPVVDPVAALGNQLDALWKNGEHDRAAALLASPPFPLKPAVHRAVVGPHFADVLTGDDDAVAAFDALQKRGLAPEALLEIAGALDQRGKHALAFRLAERIAGRGTLALDLTMRAYGFALRWEGAAIDPQKWALSRIPAEQRLLAHVAAFGARADRLFPALAPEAVRHDSEGELVWLVRAAAARRSKDEGKLRALQKALEKVRISDYHRIARYLVGLEDEASVLSFATNGARACEVAFYVGLRAEAEGRAEDANDWYHAAIDTGQTSLAEHRWAADALRLLGR